MGLASGCADTVCSVPICMTALIPGKPRVDECLANEWVPLERRMHSDDVRRTAHFEGRPESPKQLVSLILGGNYE